MVLRMVSSKGHIMTPHIFQRLNAAAYTEVLDNFVNTSCMWCKAVYVTAVLGTGLQISGDIGWQSIYTTIPRQTCGQLSPRTWTPLTNTRGVLLKGRLINISQYDWFHESRHYPSNVSIQNIVIRVYQWFAFRIEAAIAVGGSYIE